MKKQKAGFQPCGFQVLDYCGLSRVAQTVSDHDPDQRSQSVQRSTMRSTTLNAKWVGIADLFSRKLSFSQISRPTRRVRSVDRVPGSRAMDRVQDSCAVDRVKDSNDVTWKIYKCRWLKAAEAQIPTKGEKGGSDWAGYPMPLGMP